MTPSIAPLRNVAALIGLVERVQDRAFGLPGMATFYGPSGWGKTTAVTVAANEYQAHVVQVKDCWTPTYLGDVLWTREIIARKRISFAEQDQLLDGVFRRYRVTRCAIDQTGMGEKPVEDAQRRYGSVRVQGVLFTSAAKLDMATALKEAMQDRLLRIPAGDRVLRADLHAIRSRVGPTGIRRLISDGETDGHADRFWAGALAVSAAAGGEVEIDYRSAGRRGGFAPDDFAGAMGGRRMGFGRGGGGLDFGGFGDG